MCEWFCPYVCVYTVCMLGALKDQTNMQGKLWTLNCVPFSWYVLL